MRRARRLVIGGATVALIAAAVFLWLRTTGAAGTPVLTLLVDGAPSATVGVGSPIFLEVFLHGTRNARRGRRLADAATVAPHDRDPRDPERP